MDFLPTHTRRLSWIPAVVLFLSLTFFTRADAQAPVITAPLTTLVTFDGTNGATPRAVLVQDVDGNFYGTTFGGGSTGLGTVFQMTPSGSLTTLYSFAGSNGPTGALIKGSDGSFYGVTAEGGSSAAGTVFKITSSGTLTTLCSFNGTTNGGDPLAGLTQGSDGNFYGTTSIGGSYNYGTVFKITPSGSLTTLCSFNDTINGNHSFGRLIQGSDGTFYGTTFYGGSSGDGTVFKITSTGSLTTLYSFTGADGLGPYGGLIQGNDGNFYETTQYGGASGNGTVFKITPSGLLTTLNSFAGANGQRPHGELIQGSDGNFYGTTYNGGSFNKGTIFEIIPTGTVTTLYSLSFFTYGEAVSDGGLVVGSDGNFYGTAAYGGSNRDGTVFKWTPPYATLTTGNAFSYQITASGNPTSYGASSLPPGLTVNSSGLISGTPTTAGTYAVTISATNGLGTGTATLNLTVNSSAPLPITWSGAINNVWDNATANWTYNQNSITYLNGDTVTFSDSGSGGTVTFNGTYSPGSLISNNSAKNYTLSGTGTLTGAMTLTKSGTGTLTLSEANTFTGTTTINAGTLTFVGSSALPAGSAISLGSGTLQVNNDGAGSNGTIALGNNITLDTSATAAISVANNGSSHTDNTVAFGALNNGTTAQAFNSTFNFVGANGYAQSFTSLGLTGSTGYATTLNPTSSPVTIAGNVINQETSYSGHYDTLNLSGTVAGNSITGGIADSSGYTSVGNGDTRLTANGAGTWTLSGASTYHGPTALTGGTFILTGSLAHTQSVTTSNAAVLTESSAGTIGGTATLTQGSSATSTLAGTNTYTGATTVSKGTLLVNGSVTSAVSVSSGATLGGSGTINGSVTAASGSGFTFNVTSSGVTGLTIKGNLALTGTINVTPTVVSGSLANGTYTVATYTGTLTGTPTFVWSAPNGSTQAATFNTSTPGVITATVTATASAVKTLDLNFSGSADRLPGWAPTPATASSVPSGIMSRAPPVQCSLPTARSPPAWG